MRADEERRGQPRAQPEVEQLLLFGVKPIFHVAAAHRLALGDRFEDRAGGGARRAGREHLVRGCARGRQHLESISLEEDDAQPVERYEPAHLADERAERLVEPERGAERPRAAVRRLQHVDAPSECVP